jgi:hypothetical protein
VSCSLSLTNTGAGFDRLLGMNTYELIEQLQAERHRIDAVIKLLSDSGGTTPTKLEGLSAEGRKRISEAMKKRWAKTKARKKNA